MVLELASIVTTQNNSWYATISPEKTTIWWKTRDEINIRRYSTHTERLIIAIFILLYCFLTSPLPSLQPVPGFEIVGSAEVRKREHENKTGGNWGDQGPFTFASFLLSVSLVWPGYHRRRRIGNRDLKIRGWRRQRKRRWTSEFAFLQCSSRLLQVTNFVRCRRTLLKLNSWEPYPSSETERKFCRLLCTSSVKREIRHFHVEVVQRRQRHVQKSVMQAQSCCFGY